MWPKFSVRLLGVVSVLQVTFQVGSFTSVNMKQLNKKENQAISKLKRRLKKERLKLPRYMTEDYYLARWLQVREYDVDGTFTAFKKTLEWRANEKVDTILKEDWSDMRQKFPYCRNTTDEDGRPIMYIDISKWNVADYLSQGKEAHTRFLRYMIMWGEEGDAHVKRLRDQGKDVTQVTMLVNLTDFGTFKHAGLLCLRVYREACLILHPHYPNWRYKLVTVNSPSIFQAAYYVLNGASRKDFVVYGKDHNHWEPKLLESIALNQIPKEL